VSAFLKANPKVSPSAHLWQTTAAAIERALTDSVSRPIARPSNTAWIPIAIYKIYGVHGDIVNWWSSCKSWVATVLLRFVEIMSFAYEEQHES